MKRFAGRATARLVLSRAALAAKLAAPVVALLATSAARAADINAVNNAANFASGVGAGTAVPALGVGAVLQTIVALFVVVGLVLGCAWLARRFGLQPANRGGLVKTVGGASLGGKERVAVVEIGDTWLVLGTAPGNVRLLHTMPAGSAGAESAGATQAGNSPTGADLPGSFGQRFRDALKGEIGKRFNGQGREVR